MNSQSFDLTKPQGRKHFQKFLDTLIDYNNDTDNDDYNDIHIRQEDCGYIVIEWEKTPWSKEWGGRFEFLTYDQEIYEEVSFPDNHYEMLPKGTGDEAVKEWLKDHPEWVKTSYGTWTNVEDNRRSAIDWRIDEWVSREVKENDSTFSISYVDCGANDPLLTALMAVDSDVLRRTDFIVIGSALLPMCMKDTEIALNKSFDADRVVSKIGVYNLKYTNQESWQEKPETIDVVVHVYHNSKVGNSILFLTDSHYLIHKAIVKKEDE